MPKKSSDISQMCPSYVPDMSQVCPRYIPDMSQVCPIYVSGMSHICLLPKERSDDLDISIGQSSISVSLSLLTTNQTTTRIKSLSRFVNIFWWTGIFHRFFSFIWNFSLFEAAPTRLKYPASPEFRWTGVYKFCRFSSQQMMAAVWSIYLNCILTLFQWSL